MLKLRKVELVGFKSFCEKTHITFSGSGLTCIIGPNGCGKSNVADAIRWALGEQSPKLLRGQKMEDVIFHGTASRRSIGMAEVNLLFHNDGQEEIYLGSSDWMNRNIYRRIEVCFPLYESRLKAEMQELIRLQLADNTAAMPITAEKASSIGRLRPWRVR